MKKARACKILKCNEPKYVPSNIPSIENEDGFPAALSSVKVKKPPTKKGKAVRVIAVSKKRNPFEPIEVSQSTMMDVDHVSEYSERVHHAPNITTKTAPDNSVEKMIKFKEIENRWKFASKAETFIKIESDWPARHKFRPTHRHIILRWFYSFGVNSGWNYPSIAHAMLNFDIFMSECGTLPFAQVLCVFAACASFTANIDDFTFTNSVSSEICQAFGIFEEHMNVFTSEMNRLKSLLLETYDMHSNIPTGLTFLDIYFENGMALFPNVFGDKTGQKDVFDVIAYTKCCQQFLILYTAYESLSINSSFLAAQIFYLQYRDIVDESLFHSITGFDGKLLKVESNLTACSDGRTFRDAPHSKIASLLGNAAYIGV